MKIINLTVGKNPPVIRVNSKSYKAVCYKLLQTKCEVDVQPSLPSVPAFVYNKTAYNHPYSIYSGSELLGIRYRIYNEGAFVRTGFVPLSENKFKVVIPPMAEGYYYLEVFGQGGYNKVMINVT